MRERGGTESVVEQAALAWLESAGCSGRYGVDDYGEVALAQRLRDSLARLDPALPAEALDDAFHKLTRLEGAERIRRNRAFVPEAQEDWK
ncbi:MAG: hypothetical protein HZB39_16960 [Planctomycetes bacterium]|nr:hypothetical protein [Planctomycetota bacterium]